MKVLYAASEATPFAKSGGLADVAGALPKDLVRDGVDCRVVIPLYGNVKFRDTMQYVTNFTVPVGWRNQYCGLFTAVRDGVTFYFLDNEYYFKRGSLYGFFDDGERFAFFARAVLEMMKYADFFPDILHCNDWQTALSPLYLNLYYRYDVRYAQMKTIFSIHNIAYQGQYGLDILGSTCGIYGSDANLAEYNGDANFMKAAIVSCDQITTVSPTYAKEILDPWFGSNLDGLLREHQFKLSGILNGIDQEVNDPATDPALIENYDASTVGVGKAACKQALLARFGLENDGSPVMGMVTRLAGHKGLDIVREIGDAIVAQGIQLVILGTGEAQFEAYFSDLAARHPGRVGVFIGFDTTLAQQIYAGCDLFLMPSKSEPCGLSQMVSCRYGTLPIIRETGGLKDSIQNGYNGFTFYDYYAPALLDACTRAQAAYEDKEEWDALVQRAMACDFSWSASAKQYEALYDEVSQRW
ncbi:MAG: glycogen synthase [Clostridiales bacterium]|nr:glycogen synthase [Clostridiales bacterium]MCD7856209.1 glycogen synthase [Clostridiales bacterium]MCD8143631.1 glycogen synthase [Clostridiales bacterium]